MVQESVEGFRGHLAKLQNMKGLTSEEKGVIMYNLYVWIYSIMYLNVITVVWKNSPLDIFV